MLTLTVPGVELFDNKTQKFSTTETTVLELEHSLVSLSKWESKWNIPFLGRDEKTNEQIIDYVKLMTLTPDVPDEVYLRLSDENYEQINGYINSKQTATWFREDPNSPKNREIITAEIIYYWMIALKIPQEYQWWHLARLFTLVRVLNQKNQPPKKAGNTQSAAAQRRALNEARQRQYNTTG